MLAWLLALSAQSSANRKSRAVNSCLSLNTKLKVYEAVVLSWLLYACETWTDYSRRAKTLDDFHIRWLRTLLRVKCQDRVPGPDVLQRAGMESILAILLWYEAPSGAGIKAEWQGCPPHGRLSPPKQIALGRPINRQVFTQQTTRYKNTL